MTVFGIRLVSVLKQGDLFETTGGEGSLVYGIWRAQHGHPLYAWPAAEDYTFYASAGNFLFYVLYGRLFAACGIGGDGILVWGRLLSALFALLGAGIQWRLLSRLASAGASRPVMAILALAPLLVWLGPFVSWWALSVRPDVAAVSAAIAALSACLRGLERNSVKWILLASLVFFLSWSLKQSCVWTWAGACFTLAFDRRLRQAAALAIPCGALITLALLLGGEVYRHHVLWAQSPLVVTDFSLSHATSEAARGVLPVAFFWAGLAYAPALRRDGSSRGTAAGGEHTVDEPGAGRPAVARLLTVVFGLSVSFGVLILARSGTSRNHLFEAFVAASILSSWGFVRVLDASRGGIRSPALPFGVLLPLTTAAFCGVQIVRFNEIGRLTLASREEYLRTRDFAAFLERLPKPVFIRHGILAQPWHSTEGRFPAPVVDWLFYTTAEKRGLLRKGGLARQVAERRYGTLVIGRDGVLYPTAVAAGYEPFPMPPDFKRWGLILLRPGASPCPPGTKMIPMRSVPAPGATSSACTTAP